MPKKPSKIAKNTRKTTAKLAIRSRKANPRKGVKRSTPTVSKKNNNQGKIGTSSFDTWLSAQVSERMRHPSSETPAKAHLAPPANTFDSWLQKQPVVEKESVLSSTVITSTYENWISKQVAAKKLEPEQEQADPVIAIDQEITSAEEIAALG